MDRQIVYVGAIPQDVDQLSQNKNVMFGLGYLIQAVLGSGTWVDGLSCTPTSPAGMTVNVGPGAIYAVENVDGSAYGSLAPDTTHQIMKQGLAINTANLSCPAPATSGQSIVYLVEAAYEDVDGGSTVLPYYNASNPAVAYNGPNNTGVSQNTVRQGVCQIQIKAGVAATTGTQTTPSPDAGFTGLWAITVANGATTITSGNIQQLSTAPFVSPKLTGIIADIQSGAPVYAQDTSGAANTITVALTPAISSYQAGQVVKVKVANTTTTNAAVMNVNGLGNVALYDQSGNPLPAGALQANGLYTFMCDGSHFQLQGLVAGSGHGQCRLTVSGSNLALNQFNGNKLIINGVSQPIPSGGITLAPTGLTPSTLYYIYAYMNGSSMTLEASTTGHTTNGATGVEVKSSDSSRTLVGMAYINTGPAFADTVGQRYTASYFNRRLVPIGSPSPLSGQTTTSSAFVALLTAANAAFLTWGDEDVHVIANAIAANSAMGNSCGVSIGIDSTTAVAVSGQMYSAAANQSAGLSAFYESFLSEGLHTAVLLGSTSAGTATYSSGALVGTVRI